MTDIRWGKVNAGNYPTVELPPVTFDFAKLHWLKDDPFQPEAETPRYYEVKAQVAAYLKPKRVVEIGVRAGYSALAFYQGFPFEKFYGMDSDTGCWGGVKGYCQKAEAQLDKLGVREYTLSVQDSQQIKQLPVGWVDADLLHVDGDHTPKGCAHDIMLGLNSYARHILVDDYDNEHVADGADWAIRTFGLEAYYVPDGGYRGNVLIVCPEDGPKAVHEGLRRALGR